MNKATVLEKFDADVVRKIPYGFAKKRDCVAAKLEDDELTVLLSNAATSGNDILKVELEKMTGYEILLLRAPLEFIQDVQSAIFEDEAAEAEARELDDLLKSLDGSPTLKSETAPTQEPPKPKSKLDTTVPDHIKNKPVKKKKTEKPAAPKVPTITDLVIEALTGSAEGMNLKQLYETVRKTLPNTKESSVRGRCNNATAKGMLVRAGRGIYKVAGEE